MNEYAQEFFIEGNNIGILLIHGFTGSPGEMRPIYDYIKDRGYTILGVQLKGHGKTPEEMANTTWKDWLDSAVEGYNRLKKSCDRIIVAGLSMGAIISLYIAQNYDVEGVISLAAPIYIKDKSRARWSFLLKHVKPFLPKPSRKWDDEVALYGQHYDKTPVASVSHLLKLINMTAKNLQRVRCPILLIHSKNDNTALPDSSKFIYDKVKSTDKNLIWLGKCGHVITLDSQRDLVCYHISSFIQKLV